MRGTLTFSWDNEWGGEAPISFKPGKHVNRWGRHIRSARVYWLWFAVAYYRMDDYELVSESHEWSDE